MHKISYNSSERFDILNTKNLGYGNPAEHINIVYVGIEEYGGWSVKELLGESHLEVKNLLSEIPDLPGQVLALKEKFNIDLIEIVDGLISKMENQLNKVPFIYNSTQDTNSSKYSPTNKRQFLLSKKIKNLTEEDYRYFGNIRGNEVILNYFPVGRSNEKKYYPELGYFFGLKESWKFLSMEDEFKRLKLFSNYFQRLREKSNEKIYLFLMGLKKSDPSNSVSHLLFDTIKEIFELPYQSIAQMLNELAFSSFKYGSLTSGYKYLSDTFDIYFLPHPNNYRGKYENYSAFLDFN